MAGCLFDICKVLGSVPSVEGEGMAPGFKRQRVENNLKQGTENMKREQDDF